MDVLERFQENIKVKPKCYDCIHRKKRGYFYLCSSGEMGYKHIGDKVTCGKYEREEEDDL